MKKILILSFCFLNGITFAQTGDKNFIDLPYIEVTGKAELEIVPNQVFLKITIDENDSKNKIPVVELEKQMIKKLQELKIDVDKKLVIRDLSSNFKDHIILKSDIILSREYMLEINETNLLTPVFQELEKIGVSNIQIEKVEHTDMDKFRQQVKVDALKAGQTKARSLAQAIGQDIGKAIFIQEMQHYIQMAYNTRAELSLYRSSQKSETPQINFEKIKLEYAILVRFELK